MVQALGGGPGEVGVHSDGSTTLELVWHEDDGIEMRVNLYFESDGTDWWISQVWTYDGAQHGDWLKSEGPFLRSALGTPFDGDFHVGALDVKGLHLQPLLD